MEQSAAIGGSRRMWPPFLRGIRAAFVLLTRVPLGGFPYTDEDLQWSAAHLPVVGAVLGVALASVWTASTRAGELVAAALVVIASLLLTGAIHEDGLADTADALGGGATRARVFAILKDSRIGTFGGAALVVTILLRVALIARLSPRAPSALVLTEVVSRLSPVVLMTTLPYVTDPEVAKSSAVAAAGKRQLAVALAWVLVISAVLVSLRAFTVIDIAATLAAAAIGTVVCAAWFRARVGGVTGDLLGAAQQIVLCATLLLLAILQGGTR